MSHFRGVMPFSAGRIAAAGVLGLLMITAAPASIARAEEQVNVEELHRAGGYAIYKWRSAIPEPLRTGVKLATRESLTSPGWFNTVIGRVGDDLLQANPGREAEVVAYINQILIPEMYDRRSDYICGYVRLYYGHTMFLAYANVFEDPFQAVAFFVEPTRSYLRKHNISFTPEAQRQLERNARFVPDGAFWRNVATSLAHIPCETESKWRFDSGERL